MKPTNTTQATQIRPVTLDEARVLLDQISKSEKVTFSLYRDEEGMLFRVESQETANIFEQVLPEQARVRIQPQTVIDLSRRARMLTQLQTFNAEPEMMFAQKWQNELLWWVNAEANMGKDVDTQTIRHEMAAGRMIAQLQTFITESEQEHCRGQMSAEEWQDELWWWFGCEAIMCELEPDFDLKPIMHDWDYLRAAKRTIRRVAQVGTHQCAAKLRQIIREDKVTTEYKLFAGHGPTTPDEAMLELCRFIGQCDEVLGATGKWRVSLLERSEFFKAHRNGHTIREFMAFVKRAKTERLAKRAVPKGVITRAPHCHHESRFSFRTSQEVDALQASACGKGKGFRKHEQRGAMLWQREGFAHRVELRNEEDGNEVDLDTLGWLAEQQDADFGYAMLYIFQILAPPSPLPANRAAVGWIDLDDVAEKIGYNLNRCTRQEREDLRAQVWQFVLYGSCASVIGQRRGVYRDKRTGELIETRIEGAPWSIISRESPAQPALFGEVPRRVELVISKQWEPLLTHPDLVQYLSSAEAVAMIPTNQAAGAWARVIAPCLASFWRRNPRETMNRKEREVPVQVDGKPQVQTQTVWEPSLRPTRRELLTHHLPKKSPPLEVLASSDPQRAVKYWCVALGLLCESGFLAREGEPSRSAKDQLAPFGRKNWQEEWLDETVDLRPGPVQAPHVQECADALPQLKPRDLRKPKRKPGRPRKRPEESES